MPESNVSLHNFPAVIFVGLIGMEQLLQHELCSPNGMQQVRHLAAAGTHAGWPRPRRRRTRAPEGSRAAAFRDAEQGPAISPRGRLGMPYVSCPADHSFLHRYTYSTRLYSPELRSQGHAACAAQALFLCTASHLEEFKQSRAMKGGVATGA